MNVRPFECFGTLLAIRVRPRSISVMVTQSPLVSYIEVERKFLPTEHLQSHLSSITSDCHRRYQIVNAEKCSLGTLSFFRQSDHIIRDTYYDFHGRLVSKGIWIRRRRSRVIEGDEMHRTPTVEWSTEWSAKVRIGGDYTDSQFLEIQGKPEVDSLVAQHLQSAITDDLDTTAELETHRKAWMVKEIPERAANSKGKISIVLDTVTSPEEVIHAPSQFLHHIGDVEMSCEVTGGNTMGYHEVVRQRVAEGMRKTIDEFMVRHGVLFQTSPKPKDKPSVYSEWKGGMPVDECAVRKKV